MNRRDDPRVQRTRERLHRALVALVLERGWEGVDVRELCARAGVGRSTFYTHYADKEDLLAGAFAAAKSSFRAPAAQTVRRFALLHGILAHADRERRLMRALVGRKSSAAARDRFRAHVLDVVRDELHGSGDASAESTARFIAGGFLELLTWWVEARTSLTLGEIERRFTRLTDALMTSR